MKRTILIILTAAFLCLIPGEAWALFQLQVSPRRGGQSIHFESSEPGKALRNEEVTLGILTDISVPYRILQTVYQPLTNELGDKIPAGSFIVFSPSNPSGTLRTQLETPVNMGQYQIYTSTQAGDPDEFILVYNVLVPEDQAGGIYRTQLTYTAEPINAQAGISPSTRTLEVRVEIAPKFRMILETAKGARTLDLGSIRRDRPVASEALHVRIQANAAGPYRLIAQLTEPFISQQGEMLDPAAFKVSASGAQNGTLGFTATSSPLPAGPVIFYRSGEAGASDEMELRFEAAPDIQHKAGIYSGTLSFRAESSTPMIAQDVFTIPVRFEIEPIFSLDTKFEEGAQLQFGVFKPGMDTQERHVGVTVLSNMSEPYQVSQMVSRKMATDEGATLPGDAFRVQVTDAKTGSILTPGLEPVKEGEMALFVSDNKGTPEKFSIRYVLTIPKEARAGAYNSEIKYSITTL